MAPALADPDPSTLEDALLAVRCGDAEAFARVYDAFAPRVYGIAVHTLHDRHQAEEVTQEVFLQIWRTPAGFDPARGSAGAWVTTLAHRRAVDRVRASEASRRRDDKEASEQQTGDPTADTVTDALQAQTVRGALADLTVLQRQAIELAYFGGHTHTEVSRLLRIPLGTAKSRIRDGLLRLRETLSPPPPSGPPGAAPGRATAAGSPHRGRR